MIRPSEIIDDVRTVLKSAAKGKGSKPNFLTAYQILDRLPDPLRTQLIAERGTRRKGTGGPVRSDERRVGRCRDDRRGAD